MILKNYIEILCQFLQQNRMKVPHKVSKKLKYQNFAVS